MSELCSECQLKLLIARVWGQRTVGLFAGVNDAIVNSNI